MEATDLARKALEIANGRLGITEHPPGSNRGPEVDAFLAYVHTPPGYPWCSAFACASIGQAATELGISHEMKFSAGALALWHLNPGLQFTALAAEEVPAIAVHDHGGGKGHVFFVAGFDEQTGHLQTIEGNSDVEGSRTGGSVVALTRRKIDDPQLLGFLRIR